MINMAKESNTINTLRLSTWNIGGIMTNVLHLQNCLRNSDICMIQEHWLYPDSLDFLSSLNKDFIGWGRSSNNLNLDSIWRRGKGGVGMLWRKSLDASITKLEDLGNDRIIVVQVRTADEHSIFIVGVYFPSSNAAIHMYRECMDILEDIIHQLHHKGTLVILGDFNAHIGDFGGPRSFDSINEKGKELIELMQRTNFKSVNSQLFCTGPIETFYGQEGLITTTIDHIFMKVDELFLVSDCSVQNENCINLSFHLPIFCSLNIHLLHHVRLNMIEPCNKISWKLIQSPKIHSKYQKCLEKKLESYTGHNICSMSDLESTIIQFNKVLITSAKESIPRVKSKPYLKPYWSKSFKQLHYDVRKFRREWLRAGKPRNQSDQFFRNYKEAKRKFRKELRKKALENELKVNSDMQQIYKYDKSGFHKCISRKRQFRNNCGSVLKVGQNLLTDKEEVLEVWRSHYETLYTPQWNDDFDEEFKILVERKLQEYLVKSYDFHDDPLDTPFQLNEVSAICKQLPNGKAGGLDGVQYEHLKYAGDSCLTLLTTILNAIREFEDLPESTIVGVIISLFKGKMKSKLDKDNYRGITLLNVIGKILERLILNRNMLVFKKAGVPNSLQFAYQKGNSCTFGSFVLQEVISQFNEDGSIVYTCFLDSSKAFDTVWIDGLFFKLFNFGVRGKTWRLLRNWYGKMSCCVSLDGLLSDRFSIKQGIRQGGVLSPWLFMCFNNDVTETMLNTGCGAELDPSMPISNVIIADDITLISPRVKGLQKMITAMEKYSNKWRFLFNISKTTIVTFGESSVVNSCNKKKRTWYLYNQPIVEKKTCEHAGIILSSDFSSRERTTNAAKKGKEVVSSLMSVGVRPGGLNPICGAEVWKTTGLAKMLYGSQLWWNITKTDLGVLENANRFAAKRAQGLCPMTRSEAVTGNLGLWTMEGYIDKNKLSFLQKLIASSSDLFHKKIFIRRLARFVCNVSSAMQGYIVDIFKVLTKYHLEEYMVIYIESGHFPTEQSWKNTVKSAIHCHQIEIWRAGIASKPELKHYGLVHSELKPLELWAVAMRNPIFLKAIANAVNVLSGNVPSTVMSKISRRETDFRCNLCGRIFEDISYHFIMDCVRMVDERNKLWDVLFDRLPTNVCAQLFGGDDKTIYCNFFLGKTGNTTGRGLTKHESIVDITDTILLTVSRGILSIFNKVESETVTH